MQEQEQNRSEPATPFKLEEARKRGQIAKSLDVNSTLMICGMLLVMLVAADEGWQSLGLLWTVLLAGAGGEWAEGLMLGGGAFETITRSFFAILTPFATAGVVLAVLGNITQAGPVFSMFPLKPQFERLNPVAGFKRVFNKRMLFEAAKSVLKLGLFTGITVAFFLGIWPSLPSLEAATPSWQSAWFGAQATGLLFRLSLALAFVALLDWLWSRYSYAEQMRMSRRELKEEVKRREGDPLIRAKLRELQRENAKQARSMSRIKDADVIITNPQHLSIALRYVRGQMSAPEVLAKGAEHWAAEIRAVAHRHGVPRLERRELAQQLFRSGRVGESIPAECYIAVAHAYADLAAQKRARSAGATVAGSILPPVR
jgi:flagellar biosynthesis protein FlhB